MSSGNTSRLTLPYPVASDPANPPADFLALANRLDNIATGFYSSAAASPPAPPYQGLVWYQTDTGILAYYYNSTQYLIIASAQTAASAPGSAPVGSYYYNSTNKTLSVNTGTLSSPSWQAIVPAVGSAGTVLTSNGTSAAWSTPSIPASQISGSGSSTGQFLVSTGSGTAPTWQNILVASAQTTASVTNVSSVGSLTAISGMTLGSVTYSNTRTYEVTASLQLTCLNSGTNTIYLYLCNGSTSLYTLPFQLMQPSDFQAYHATVITSTLNGAMTLNLRAQVSGGTITVGNSAQASVNSLSIKAIA
jgi:hypothetical protein